MVERVSQAPVIAQDQRSGVLRANAAAVAGVAVAAGLFKASIVAAVRRVAPASAAARAGAVVAAEPEAAGGAADGADSQLLSSVEQSRSRNRSDGGRNETAK